MHTAAGRLARAAWAAALIGVALVAPGGAAEELRSVKHPWYDGRLDDAALKRARRSVAPLIALSDEQLRALVPQRRPISSRAKLPGCNYARGVAWSPARPRHIRIGGEAFIPEERFPPTDRRVVVGPDGTRWTYEYLKDELGEPIYPSCVRDAAAREWLVRAALDLARIYHTTGDAACARKAAVLIARFAEVFPSWPIYGSRSSKGPRQFFHKEPYPTNSGKWRNWYPVELARTEPLVLAYDLVCASGAVAQLSKELGRDVRRDIELGFFLGHCKLVMKYDGWHAKSLSRRTHNVQPYKCRGMISIGRTIGHPELVHYAHGFVAEAIEKRFMVDGVFPESPSYQNQMVGNLSTALERLRGYSDPPGYTDPRTGRRFDRFDPEAAFPTFARARAFLRRCYFPDGKFITTHDTWPKYRRQHKRAASSSRIWPAFGHAVLGRGRGDAQMEAHLHFSEAYGHAHHDTLNLILWACGEELLSDIGYTYTYRGWSSCSLAHNLVVVDGATQRVSLFGTVDRPETAVGGQVVAWAPVEHGFGVVAAEDVNSYPTCSRYRRTLLLAEDDDEHAFCVDVFEVAGGTQHDWLAHGSADRDQRLTFDKRSVRFADSLAPDGKIHIPTPTWQRYVRGGSHDMDEPGKLSPYWGNIRRVGKVHGPGPWRATFAGLEAADARLRLHLLAPTDCALYHGEAPSIRRAKEHVPDIEKFMMPILTARRTGGKLASRFVAVWEPFRREPWLTRVAVVHDAPEGLVVEVESRKARTIVAWSPDGARPLTAGGIELDGRFACVQQRGDTLAMAMVEGRSLRASGHELVAEADPTLALLAAGRDETGDYLVARGAVPRGLRRAKWGILLHPGGATRALRLGKAEARGDHTWLRCPDGHGLACDEDGKVWTETCFPSRTFQGEMRLRLVSRVHRAF